MALKGKLLGVTLLVLLSSGLLFALQIEKTKPLSDDTASEMVESSTTDPSCWTPCYTGKERAWDYAAPWSFDAEAGETPAFNQDEGLAVLADIGPKGKVLPGFAGCYINCSGTLTVALVDPQPELLSEYAKASHTGFWIVDAQYTLEELDAASKGIHQQIYDWIIAHPESKLQFGSASIDTEMNRYVVKLYGPSLKPILDAFPDLSPCIELLLHLVQDASAEHEIPREPETTWSALDGALTVSLPQQEYPIGTEEITVILENNSSGVAMYGESYSMEKYIDGTWKNISGNLNFSAIGLILSEHDHQTLTISTTLFPSSLGVGLYRIIGTTLSYTAETGLTATETDCYVVEFLVTEDAPVPTDNVPETRGH